MQNTVKEFHSHSMLHVSLLMWIDIDLTLTLFNALDNVNQIQEYLLKFIQQWISGRLIQFILARSEAVRSVHKFKAAV